MGDNSKFKIVVVGVGGVGGFVGGRLAAQFAKSNDVEIALVVRGENEKAIRENGLKIISTQGEEIVRPQLAAIDEIGDADLLILCTKEYHLEDTIASLKDSIGEKTSILSLLNGVDAAGRIVRILPAADIWKGCIYIVSRLAAPGVIQETGSVCTIFFGSERGETEKQKQAETIFREAAIDAHLTEEIEAKLWEKFIFISTLAAATSYLNASISEVLKTGKYKDLLDDLLAEIKQIAKAKNINISEEAIYQRLDKASSLPAESTSSMHTDFLRGNRAEIESLVGYVVREAKQLNVPTPIYEKIYGELVLKQKTTNTVHSA